MEEETGVESTEVTTTPQEIETQSNDLASDLAADLYPKAASEPDTLEAESVENAEETKTSESEEPEIKPARQAPKSWTKEMQAKYGTLPEDIQDYVILREKQMMEGLEKDRGDANLGRVMRDIMTPYRPMLQAAGVDEGKAVQSLLNVHYKLTTLAPADKQAYFAEIAKGYGIDLSSMPQQEQQQLDPTVKKLMDELNGIKQTLTLNQQHAINESKEKVVRDVEAFASDPNHAYFDEIADDIASLITAGYDLETAYEKAVWANPVTRQKEIARIQTEKEAALKEKAKATAEAAKKAASLNVKARDTSRVPTGPKATMRNLDSALEESMREIRSRAH